MGWERGEVRSVGTSLRLANSWMCNLSLRMLRVRGRATTDGETAWWTGASPFESATTSSKVRLAVGCWGSLILIGVHAQADVQVQAHSSQVRRLRRAALGAQARVESRVESRVQGCP